MTDQEKQQLFNTYSNQFDEYLKNENDSTFTPTALIEFCKNELKIEYAKDKQTQDFMKNWINSYKLGLENYYQGNKEAIETTLKTIFKLFPKLPNKHVKSWSDFTTAVINFDDSKDYHSSIFERRFPVGTISYIGARPGRGKTTMLINLGLDALKKNKPVVFVTAEETTKQILTRFILSETYSNGINNASLQYAFYESFKTRTNLFNYIKDSSKSLGMSGTVNNQLLFENATKTIKGFIDNEQLIIFEAYGATFEEMTDYLKTLEAGTVVLVDYIQHLKSPDRFITQQRQVQIQEVSHQLADLSGTYGLITISGAQFTRPKQDSQKDIEKELRKPDSFNESSFREAGDIEQDGHILIGIGKDGETLFYTCMKDRESSPDDGDCWKLKKQLSYSFLQGEKDKDGKPVPYKSEKKENGKQTETKKPSKEEKHGNFR